jgi:hypothetical protein
MKKGLLIVAAVLMLAGAAQAGEIKLHVWPCAFIAQDLMTIPVTMDVGYWIRVKSQTKYVIKMAQIDIHTYDGCVTIPVECNFNATLSTKIDKFTANGDITAGGWVGLSSSVTPSAITPGTTNVSVCAHVTNANLGALVGGAKDVQVATVTLKVAPTV